MRVPRVLAGACLTILIYIFSLAILAPVQPSNHLAAQFGVGEAHADAASADTACSDQKGSLHKACTTGFLGQEASKPNTDACSPYSKPAEVNACNTGYNLADTSGSGGPANGAIDQEKCAANIGSFSWMACPLFDDISQFIAGTAKDLITQFMAIQPLQLSGAIYDTWSGMRLLANVLFVLVFMVIIFAQLLQYELGVYAIKRMIPRLVAAAVLVQFSYILSSILVDVGNILGVGIGITLDAVTHGGHPAGGNVGGVLENITTILVGAAGVGGLASIAYFAGAAMVMPIFIVILITAFAFITTLAFRYFFIGILIVVSPLALIAWVLPNTEQYFSKWLSTFVKLILMYPIIMALLSIAGNVGGLIPAATTSGSVDGHIGQNITTSVIKILVVAGCFMQVPKTFQWAGGIMADVHSRMNDLGGKARSAYWNSPKTGAMRSNARDKLKEAADSLDKGFEKGTGKFRWLGLGKDSNNAFVQKARNGLHGPATLLLTGQSGDKTVRDVSYGQRVIGHHNIIKEMEAAGVSHNVEQALNHKYFGDMAQKAGVGTAAGQRWAKKQEDARAYLKSNDAETLLDWTGTKSRREALMRQLGSSKSLKPALQKTIQDTGNTEELMAYTRQWFSSNYDGDYLGAGIDSSSKLKPQVDAKLQNLDAAGLKGTGFSDRNLEIMSAVGTHKELKQSDEANQKFADLVGTGFLTQNFTHGDHQEWSGRKKTLSLLAMARSSRFETGKGKEMREAVIKQVARDMQHDPTTHAGAIRDFHAAAIKDAKDGAAERGITMSDADAKRVADDLLQKLTDADPGHFDFSSHLNP